MASDHDAPTDDEIAADEPRTPLWLPLVGLCLFVGALVYALAMPRKPDTSPSAGAAPSATASAAPTPAPGG